MLERSFAVLLSMIFVTVAHGCSTPDGDNMDSLVSMVGGWSQAARARVIGYAMNRKALEWVWGQQDSDEEFGRTKCYRPDNTVVEVGSWRIYDILACLTLDPMHDYRRCTVGFLDDAANLSNGVGKDRLEKLHGSPLSQCYSEIVPRFEPDYQDPLLVDPEAWEDEDIVRAILNTPGGIPIPGGLLPGLLPRLCPLAKNPEAYGCPGTPGGAPGQIPGDAPAGDYP